MTNHFKILPSSVGRLLNISVRFPQTFSTVKLEAVILGTAPAGAAVHSS